MSEGMWGDVGDADEFALPGDDQLMEQTGVGEPAAEPAEESPAAEPLEESEGFEAEPEPTLILGKYKDAAALEHAHDELTSAYRRQSNEVGELRRLQEQLLQTQQAQWQAQNQSPLDDLIDENPQQAMLVAAQRQDWQGYHRAKQAWDDLSPGAPALFEQQAQMQQQMQQIQAQLQATAGPVADQQATRAVVDAYSKVAAELPEIEELRPAMRQIISELSTVGQDWITPAMESGDPARAHQALRTLAFSARGMQGQNLASQARDAARQHVAETERAKQQSVVASASTTLTQSPPSAADRLAEGWDEIDSPFQHGDGKWNI